MFLNYTCNNKNCPYIKQGMCELSGQSDQYHPATCPYRHQLRTKNHGTELNTLEHLPSNLSSAYHHRIP
ncbi:MAG: hypothetical protein PWP31_1284 [Clostridia bacterium]|nr:hypothetical protein [Clostridia bacterium]